MNNSFNATITYASKNIQTTKEITLTDKRILWDVEEEIYDLSINSNELSQSKLLIISKNSIVTKSFFTNGFNFIGDSSSWLDNFNNNNIFYFEGKINNNTKIELIN